VAEEVARSEAERREELKRPVKEEGRARPNGLARPLCFCGVSLLEQSHQLGDGGESFLIETVEHLLALALTMDESGHAQESEVMAGGGLGEFQTFAQHSDGLSASAQVKKHLDAGCVRKHSTYVSYFASLFHVHQGSSASAQKKNGRAPECHIDTPGSPENYH